MFKNKILLFSAMNLVLLLFMLNTGNLVIEYFGDSLIWIVPLLYCRMVVPIITLGFFIYLIYKFIKRRYTKKDILAFFMNILIVISYVLHGINFQLY